MELKSVLLGDITIPPVNMGISPRAKLSKTSHYCPVLDLIRVSPGRPVRVVYFFCSLNRRDARTSTFVPFNQAQRKSLGIVPNGASLSSIAVNLGLSPDPSGAVPKFTNHEELWRFAPQKPGQPPCRDSPGFCCYLQTSAIHVSVADSRYPLRLIGMTLKTKF